MKHAQAFLIALVMFTGCAHTAATQVEAPHAQRIGIVEEELTALITRPEIRRARIVVVSVATGEVLSASGIDRTGARRDLATDEVRTHGSAGKPLTIAAALDAGAVQLSSTFPGANLERDGIAIADHEMHETLSLEDVVAFSSNVGTTQIGEALGAPALIAALGRFHLAERAPNAAQLSAIDAARLAFGPGLATTSVELAQSYAVLARGGTWTDGTRVVSSDAAHATMALLAAAVQREDGTGHRAAALPFGVAGKTGTMPIEGGTFGVFVGAFPADAPEYVVLVGIESSDASYSGGTLAAPSFVRVARALAAGE